MTYDPTRPTQMAKTRTVYGHRLPVGTVLIVTPEPKKFAEVDEAMATRLFNSELAIYSTDATPTPIAPEGTEPLPNIATISPMGGGWFEVSAPWLAEPFKVQGQEAAQRAAQRLEAGEAPEAILTENEPDAPVSTNSSTMFVTNTLVLTSEDEDED